MRLVCCSPRLHAPVRALLLSDTLPSEKQRQVMLGRGGEKEAAGPCRLQARQYGWQSTDLELMASALLAQRPPLTPPDPTRPDPTGPHPTQAGSGHGGSTWPPTPRRCPGDQGCLPAGQSWAQAADGAERLGERGCQTGGLPLASTGPGRGQGKPVPEPPARHP